MGHRSLLLHLPRKDRPFFVLSSVAYGFSYHLSGNQNEKDEEEEEIDTVAEWQEIPTIGIYFLEFSDHKTVRLDCTSRMNIPKSITNQPSVLQTFQYLFGVRTLFHIDKCNNNIVPTITPPVDNKSDVKWSTLAAQLKFHLLSAVKVRTLHLPPAYLNMDFMFPLSVPHKNHKIQLGNARLGILFSGGIDSLLLCALADALMDPNEPIDLLNVAFTTHEEILKKGKFKSYQVPDRLNAREALKELQKISKREFRLIEINVHPDQVNEAKNMVFSLVYPRQTVMDFTIGMALWFAARGCGWLFKCDVYELQNNNNNDNNNNSENNNNISMENSKETQNSNIEAIQQGLEDTQNDKNSNNDNNNNNHDNNIDKNQLDLSGETPSKRKPKKLTPEEKKKQMEERKQKIKNKKAFVSPEDAQKTEEDDLQLEKNAILYQSGAKVLLSGLGVDEMAGGYKRHRSVFNVGGWDKLEAEIYKDLTRLWYRNLGRDDRVISSNGREIRFPFLDENVLQFVCSLPLSDIMNLEEAMGVGDKKIFRQVAFEMGLQQSAFRPKRAIQFGSRVSKAVFPNTHTSKIDGTASFSI